MRWWKSCFTPSEAPSSPAPPNYNNVDKQLLAKQAERIMSLNSQPNSVASSGADTRDFSGQLPSGANWSRRPSALLVAQASNSPSKDIDGLVALHQASLMGLQELVPPPTLLDDLQLLGELGHGGYARCYEGQWRAGVKVAVKIFCTSPASHQHADRSSVDSGSSIPLPAVAEGLLSKTLAHPCVVNTFDARCSCVSFAFLAAVFCEDKSDAALLRDIPKLAMYYEMKLNPLQVKDTEEQVKQLAAQWSNSLKSHTPLFASSQPQTPSDQVTKRTPEVEIWQSQEGFGDPKERRKPICWRDVLLAIGAYPGSYITVLVMQYCEMGTLEKAILKGVFKSPGPTSSDHRRRFRCILRTLREVAQALEYFDQCGLVHGDIKPANVLLNSSRTDARGFSALVADLGMMSITQSEKGTARGTVQFMAPELFLTGTATSSADIYALGILMWTMVTATRPYADIPEDQIMSYVSGRKLRPKWPANQFPELEVLYQSCVAHNAETRPKAAFVVKALIAIEEEVRRGSCTKRLSPVKPAAPSSLTEQSKGPGPGPAPAPVSNVEQDKAASADKNTSNDENAAAIVCQSLSH